MKTTKAARLSPAQIEVLRRLFNGDKLTAYALGVWQTNEWSWPDGIVVSRLTVNKLITLNMVTIHREGDNFTLKINPQPRGSLR